MVDGTGVGNDQNGLRGLVVTRQAEKRDILLSIPLKACWVTTGSEVNAGKEDFEWSATLPKKVQLALLVLEGWQQHHQQDVVQSEDWKPFLDSWPDAVPGLPQKLSLEELERDAQCPQLVEATRNHMSWVLSNYVAAQKLAPPTDDNSLFGMVDVDLPTFQKALQLVGSRSIRVSASSSILVPLLDLANHDANPSTTYNLNVKSYLNDDDEQPSIQLVADRTLAAGNGVTISYGDYDNQLMAGCYGFVPQPNPHNMEHLTLKQVVKAAGIDDDGSNSKTITQQIDYVSQMGLPTSNFRLSSGGLIDSNLWLALRWRREAVNPSTSCGKYWKPSKWTRRTKRICGKATTTIPTMLLREPQYSKKHARYLN